MAEHFVTLAEADPDRPAIIDEFASLTRAELNRRVNQLVHGLRGAGLETGDTVAVLSGNRHEYFEAILAVGVSSWVVVPLNWHLTAEEIAYILNDSGAKALLVDAEFADLAEAALSEAPGVAVRILFGGPSPAGFTDYEDLL